MSTLIAASTATSWDFSLGWLVETDERVEVIERAGTSSFVSAEEFDVLPRRLWLTHSRAIAIARRGKPHVPTPEFDIGSDR